MKNEIATIGSRIRWTLGLLAFVASFGLQSVSAKESLLTELENVAGRIVPHTTSVAPTGGEIEVGFSPDEGAESLVLKVIDSAKKEIRLLGYSFTSAPVTRALVSAKHRGVDVAVIVDHKNNLIEDRSGKARHVLGALVNAGIRVRTISVYPIHHDKTIIVDGQHVETGSFNFSDAAAHKNSENVLVLWNNPVLAKIYRAHWESRYALGMDFKPNE